MAATALMSGAVVSDCGRFRTRLWRVWDDELPRLLWIMLNPSTADASVNDATIRKTIAFAKLWGFGGIEVCNLYSYRTKSPNELMNAGWLKGPDNERTLRAMLDNYTPGSKAVAAWGTWALSVDEKWLRYEAAHAGVPLYHLGLNKGGSPKHPLYLPMTTTLTEWIE